MYWTGDTMPKYRNIFFNTLVFFSLGCSRMEWGPVLLSKELGLIKSLLERKVLLLHLWWCDNPRLPPPSPPIFFGIKAVYSRVYYVTERGKQTGSEMPMLWLSRDTWLSSHFVWKNILPLTKWYRNISMLKKYFLQEICLNIYFNNQQGFLTVYRRLLVWK